MGHQFWNPGYSLEVQRTFGWSFFFSLSSTFVGFLKFSPSLFSGFSFICNFLVFPFLTLFLVLPFEISLIQYYLVNERPIVALALFICWMSYVVSLSASVFRKDFLDIGFCFIILFSWNTIESLIASEFIFVFVHIIVFG